MSPRAAPGLGRVLLAADDAGVRVRRRSVSRRTERRGRRGHPHNLRGAGADGVFCKPVPSAVLRRRLTEAALSLRAAAASERSA